jgi:hypothetical protein
MTGGGEAGIVRPGILTMAPRVVMAALALFAAVLTSVVAQPGAVSAQSPDPIYVITDSVGLGARAALTAAFPDRRVTIDGVPGLSIAAAAQVVNVRRAEIGRHVVIALGYNDDPNTGRVGAQLDSLIATLSSFGVRRIVLMGLRQDIPPGSSPAAVRQSARLRGRFVAVNAQVVSSVQRNPSVVLVNWNAVSQQPTLTYDAIHLTPEGANLFAASAASALSDRGGVAPGVEHRLAPIPAGVAWLEVRTSPALDDGFVNLYDCDGPVPSTSMVTVDAGQPTRQLLPVRSSGSVCMRSSVLVHVSVDLVALGSGSSVGELASRVLDSRTAGPGPWPVPDGVVVATSVMPTRGSGLRVRSCTAQGDAASESGRIVASLPAGRIASTVVAIPPGSCVDVDGDGALLIDRLAQPDGFVGLGTTLWSGRLEPPEVTSFEAPIGDGSLMLVRLDVSPTSRTGLARIGVCGSGVADFEMATTRAALRSASVLVTPGAARCLTGDVGLLGRVVLDGVVPGQLVPRQNVFDSRRA